MPIVKCPKCGKEYDTMYSFHSCKKSKKENKQEIEEGGRNWKENIIYILIILGIIGALIIFSPLGILVASLDIPIISDFLVDFSGEEPYCPGSDLDCQREPSFGPGPFR